MPTLHGLDFLRPSRWQDFEALLVDLLERREFMKVGEVQRFGRTGQSQHGVDIAIQTASGVKGYQCKRQEGLSYADVMAELMKAETFRPRLVHWAVLTTAALDSRLQGAIYELSVERQRQGKFPVEVVFWDTITQWLAGYPEIAHRHYPDFVASLAQLQREHLARMRSEFSEFDITVTRSRHGETVEVEAADGAPIELTLSFPDSEGGRTAREEFESVRRNGGRVQLPGRDIILDGPGPIAGLLREFLPPGAVARSVSLERAVQKDRIRVGIGIRAADFTKEMTIRRMLRDAALLIPGTVYPRRYGTDVREFQITLDNVPVEINLLIERNAPPRVTFSGEFANRSLEEVLAGERFLMRLSGMPFVGVFHRTSGSGKLAELLSFRVTEEHDADRVELGRLICRVCEGLLERNYELTLGEDVSRGDFTEAESFLTLLTANYRVLSRVEAHFPVDSERVRRAWRRIIKGEEFPFSGGIEAGERPILGQLVRHPPVWIEVDRATLSASDRDRIVSNGALPFEVTLYSAPGARVVEHLLPEPDELLPGSS